MQLTTRAHQGLCKKINTNNHDTLLVFTIEAMGDKGNLRGYNRLPINLLRNKWRH